MNKYKTLKDKHQKMINDFPCFYAFSHEQLEDGIKSLNTTKEEIYSVGYGGFIRKSDSKAYKEMWDLIHKESEEALKDPEYLYQGFVYELANHEFCYTYDYTDTLDVFGLKEETLTEEQTKILVKAKNYYLDNCEDC